MIASELRFAGASLRRVPELFAEYRMNLDSQITIRSYVGRTHAMKSLMSRAKIDAPIGKVAESKSIPLHTSSRASTCVKLASATRKSEILPANSLHPPRVPRISQDESDAEKRRKRDEERRRRRNA